jgi:hypothetical protein
MVTLAYISGRNAPEGLLIVVRIINRREFGSIVVATYLMLPR